MPSTELITGVAELGDLIAEWDALAVACAKPFSCPAWMLAWWRDVAPPDTNLTVIVVREGGELVAIAPFHAERRVGLVRYRLLGHGTSYRCEPLLAPGGTEEIAEAVAETIAAADPSPDAVVFDGVSPDSPWPEMLHATWPGGARPSFQTDKTTIAPTLELSGRTFDEWFGGKSREFRRDMRRHRRSLDELGATFRLSDDPGRLAEDLRSFAALHHARWAERGGSKALGARVERMVGDAARELLPSGRFRLWMLDVEGQPVAAQILLTAGGEAGAWLSGFDPAWAEHGPGVQLLLEAIRHAFESGDVRVDLGGGDEGYKRRFADGEDALRWVTLLPRGRRHALARAETVPRSAYRAVAGRVPRGAKQRIDRSFRKLLRRPKR